MAGELIPMVMFVVIGFITLGYFHFNSKNRQAIMDTVQKAIDHDNSARIELVRHAGELIATRAGAGLTPGLAT